MAPPLQERRAAKDPELRQRADRPRIAGVGRGADLSCDAPDSPADCVRRSAGDYQVVRLQVWPIYGSSLSRSR